MALSKYKPAVPKKWLVVIAGLVWTLTGFMLCTMALGWLIGTPPSRCLTLGSMGAMGAAAVHYFLFSGLARRNLRRISQYFDKGCVFAFQAWKSYLLIVVMVALGMTLRHFRFPRDILAVIYLTMGGALILASFLYYADLRPKKPSDKDSQPGKAG